MQAGDKKRILVLGGGFGGVTTAQQLQKQFKNSPDVEITLVNRENFFVFLPMLASAAAGSIDTLHVVNPIRRMVPRIQFREEEILGIDLRSQQVATTSRVTGRESLLHYDHLVLALGSIINLSSLPGLAQHGKTMKTLGDALHLRNHVISMLEAADIETDPRLRQEMLTFVVAGAGFSGVETIGELNDLVHSVAKDYRSIDRHSIKLILLHSGDRILPEMPPSLADFALKKLQKRGVDVRLGVRIAAATPREAILKSGERISTRTLVTTVGNAPNPVLASLNLPKEKGRIITDPYMNVPELPNVWALGDCAAVPNGSANWEYSPPTAQYALRQGKKLGDNIGAVLTGRPDRRKTFAFPGLGQLCLVGHRAGVAELFGGVKLSGFIAWLMWRNVYLSKMPSWDRRMRIGVNWGLDMVLPRDITQLNLSRSQAVNQVHYEAGDYIFRQGDVGDEFFVIVKGQVEIFREKGNQQIPVAILSDGEHFGESALIQGRRRSATARALGPVDLLSLGRDDFNSLAGTWLKFSESVKAISDERLADPAFASRLLEASQDFRTVFATGLFSSLGGAAVPLAQPVAPSPHVAPPAMAPVSPNPVPQPAAVAVAPAPRPARLVRSDGSELTLHLNEMKLGRSADNHIVLSDRQASRFHALLNRQDNTYVIVDQNTSNGTFVNGHKVQNQRLRDGDRITIGSSEFTYRQY
ncbi:MAG TPA: FAD-dependent oxidoreductase [Chloroflexia bacterium]|nr:FAD-dependent oxidoreductase [Chloroflexia bacterium]